MEASWGGVTLAFIMVVVGLLGNLMGNPEVLSVFILYVAAAGALVLGMRHWAALLRLLLLLCRRVLPACPTDALQQEIVDTQRTPVVFFLKRDDVYVLSKALRYVDANEQTRHLIIVHVYDAAHTVPPELAAHVRMIDEVRCAPSPLSISLGPPPGSLIVTTTDGTNTSDVPPDKGHVADGRGPLRPAADRVAEPRAEDPQGETRRGDQTGAGASTVIITIVVLT